MDIGEGWSEQNGIWYERGKPAVISDGEHRASAQIRHQCVDQSCAGRVDASEPINARSLCLVGVHCFALPYTARHCRTEREGPLLLTGSHALVPSIFQATPDCLRKVKADPLLHLTSRPILKPSRTAISSRSRATNVLLCYAHPSGSGTPICLAMVRPSVWSCMKCIQHEMRPESRCPRSRCVRCPPFLTTMLFAPVRGHTGAAAHRIAAHISPRIGTFGRDYALGPSFTILQKGCPITRVGMSSAVRNKCCQAGSECQ